MRWDIHMNWNLFNDRTFLKRRKKKSKFQNVVVSAVCDYWRIFFINFFFPEMNSSENDEKDSNEMFTLAKPQNKIEKSRVCTVYALCEV